MSDEAIVVQIDEDIEALMPSFFDNLKVDIAEVEKAIAESNGESIGKLGHKGKGSTGSYGFSDLQVLFHALEKAGKGNNIAECGTLLEKIKHYISCLKIEYIEIEEDDD